MFAVVIQKTSKKKAWPMADYISNNRLSVDLQGMGKLNCLLRLLL